MRKNNRRTKALRICDNAAAIMLALCPILQHYQGVFLAVSEELLCLLAPYLLFRLTRRRKLKVKRILPLAAYAAYIVINYSFALSVIVREAALLVCFAAAANRLRCERKLFSIACVIAAYASCLMAVQYVCYYVFGFHLQLVPTRFLLDSAEQWVRLAQTGLYSVTGKRMNFYRPSAFFLEPSHMALYFMPLLAVLILAPGMNRRRFGMAMTLTMGLLLSTSGLGIAIAVGLWMVYGVFYMGNPFGESINWRNIFQPKRLLFMAGFAAALVILYFTVDVFQSSVNRIFIPSSNNKTAIGGRVQTGLKSLRNLSGLKLLFGMRKSVSLADKNMAGFFYTIYKHGLVGSVLSYLFYLECFVKLKREYIWMTLLVVGLSFFTVHTYAAFYRMYFISYLLVGYSIIEKRRLRTQACAGKGKR